MENATLGAGCFWGIEAAFKKIKGVISTKVGYMGGNLKNPTYEDVCTGKTGHAEVVQITFNPDKITYQQLIQIFWSIHDPTQKNRQGPDVGAQYKSVIFYHNDLQRKIAEESKKQQKKLNKFEKKIFTEIRPAGNFWIAEEYHQNYYEKRQTKNK
jgi:peptide-methionine (S)-S-oxide reductase